MHVGTSNDQVRYLWRLYLHLLTNFEHVVVEESNDIHRAQRHDLPSCFQRKAANIEVIMDCGGDSDVAKTGEVDLVLMNIGRDRSFGDSGTQMSLGPSNLWH